MNGVVGTTTPTSTYSIHMNGVPPMGYPYVVCTTCVHLKERERRKNKQKEEMERKIEHHNTLYLNPKLKYHQPTTKNKISIRKIRSHS